MANSSTTAAQTEVLTERKTASGVKAALPSSVHLDAVRGLAAVIVFLNHWRGLFFADYAEVAHPNIVAKTLYAITGMGHSAVMVFFILSGYFISSSVLRARAQGRWSWGWYAEQRLTRLYVVLIPALVLGAAWDIFGSHLFAATPIYSDAPGYQLILKHPVAEMATLSSWLGSLFFLQQIRTPVFGSNGPLWSLSYEFWYYVLFPLGLVASARRTPLAARVLCTAAGALILWFVGRDIALYFGIWLLGTAVCLCPKLPASLAQRVAGKPAGVLFGLLLAASLLAPRFKIVPNGLWSDIVVALAFTAFLLFLLNHPQPSPGALYTRAARALSNISYSLYLIHVPVLVFLNAVIIRQGDRWQPTPGRLLEGLLVAGVVFGYTYVIWRFTEARTGQVREFILSRFRRPIPA